MKSTSSGDTYPIRTLRELLLEATARFGDKTALATKRDGAYRPVSYAEFGRRAEALATALLAMGLEKGDRVGILSENRDEWAVSYLAVVGCGLTVVPIDKDLKGGEIRQILRFAEVRVLICSEPYLDLIEEERPRLTALERVVSMDGKRPPADVAWREEVSRGEALVREGDDRFQRARVEEDDLAAIIFTSGTTGNSKGVMLTHSNIAGNVEATSGVVRIREDDVLLSVLPLHHTYECTGGFLTAFYQGATIHYAESLRRLGENIQEVRATVILGVPLLFEAIYRKIEAGIKEKGEGKFRFAKGLAGLAEKLLRIDLRPRLFRALHEKFGGRLRLLISGGAAINPEVSRGFRELGILLIQGYGMTEASPIISVNRVDHFKDASVGPPIPGVEVEIVEGEIVVRGPNVMKGYYRNEAATRETLRDGRLHTGDLGYFDEEGFLYVSGRRKSVIVLPNGKNVHPEELEILLNESPYILESLVWGGADGDPQSTEVQAILVPDRERFDEEMGEGSYEEEQVREVLDREVKRINGEIANYKRIRRFVVRWDEFEKTTTRKIKRYLYVGGKQEVGS